MVTEKNNKQCSQEAVKKHPYLPRDTYFTQADYDAMVIRVNKKRIEHDNLWGNKVIKVRDNATGIPNSSLLTDGIIKKTRIRFASNGKAISINTTIYSSFAIAAEELKISIQTVRNRINSDHPDYRSWVCINAPA